MTQKSKGKWWDALEKPGVSVQSRTESGVWRQKFWVCKPEMTKLILKVKGSWVQQLGPLQGFAAPPCSWRVGWRSQSELGQEAGMFTRLGKLACSLPLWKGSTCWSPEKKWISEASAWMLSSGCSAKGDNIITTATMECIWTTRPAPQSHSTCVISFNLRSQPLEGDSPIPTSQMWKLRLWKS